MSENVLLTLDEAATRLAVSRRTVERLVSTGRLPAVKVGAATRVRPDAVVEFACDLPAVKVSAPVRVIGLPARFDRGATVRRVK